MHWLIVPHLTVADIAATVETADVVISAAELPDWPRTSKVRLHFYFPDVDTLPDMVLANSIAGWAASQVGCARDVVVHCDEGKNRSVFLAGLILHRLGARPAIGLVNFLRKQRPGALTNQTFAAYLDSLPTT